MQTPTAVHFGSHLRALWRDQRGQDMIEYALVTSFGVVAVVAILPTTMASNISLIFSRIMIGLVGAASQG